MLLLDLTKKTTATYLCPCVTPREEKSDKLKRVWVKMQRKPQKAINFSAKMHMQGATLNNDLSQKRMAEKLKCLFYFSCPANSRFSLYFLSSFLAIYFQGLFVSNHYKRLIVDGATCTKLLKKQIDAYKIKQQNVYITLKL